MTNFDIHVHEILQLLDYLKCSVEHAEKLMSIAINIWTDENDEAHSFSSLNSESINELNFIARKISSKSDILQNKVSDFSKEIPSE